MGRLYEEDNSAGHLRGVRVLAVEEEENGTGSFDGDGFLHSFAPSGGEIIRRIRR